MGKSKRNKIKYLPLSHFGALFNEASPSSTKGISELPDSPKEIKEFEDDGLDKVSLFKSRKSSTSSSGICCNSSDRGSSASPSPLGPVVPLAFPNHDKEMVQIISEGIASMSHNLTRPCYNTDPNCKNIRVSVNCVRIEALPDKVYQYFVGFAPESTPMSIRRKAFQSFVHKYEVPVFTDFDDGTRIRPAYDGNSLLFSRVKLNIPRGSVFSASTILPDEHSGVNKKYTLSLEFQAVHDLRFLMNNILDSSREYTYDLCKIVGVILKHQMSLDYVAIGMNFFQEEKGRVYLGNGREAWIGYHQNVIPCNGRLGVVLDVACAAFYKEQPLFDFIMQFLETSIDKLEKRRRAPGVLTLILEDERKQVNNEISGLKVKTKHGNSPRLYRIVSIGKLPPKITTFECKNTGERINVEQYFFQKYGITLKYPTLPAVQVCKAGKISYLPIELCSLVRGQRVIKKLTEQQATSMIKLMASSASGRQKDVVQAIDHLKITDSTVAKDFGIREKKELMSGRALVLKPPALEYNDKNRGAVDVSVHRGSWEASNKEFKDPRVVNQWGVVNLAPNHVSREKMSSVVSSLSRQSSLNGLELNSSYEYIEVAPPNSKILIESALNQMKTKLPFISLVFIVLDGQQCSYSLIKSKGDKELGFVSQCIRWKSIIKGMRDQVYANLAMKINSKLGGINCTLSRISKHNLKLFNSPIIFMGATLSHPHNPEPRRPSVASLVGSIDPAPSQFVAYSTVQSKVHQHIVNLSEMVQSALKDFYINNWKLKPHRIVFYRDALRASLFLSIAKCEIVAIRRACLALDEDYKPGITFIVTQRRHNTRLFCSQQDSSGKVGNVPAGTCLDHTVTHPTHFDFYLSSHLGIQGTSRPTYYRVMWDDNNLSPKEIQNLTYALCHCYSRCTKSVSLPAPAYYSHLAAVRTRHHIANGELYINYDEEGLPISDEDVERAKKVLTIHENNKYRMYFT